MRSKLWTTRRKLALLERPVAPAAPAAIEPVAVEPVAVETVGVEPVAPEPLIR
jgi:hypothetical protein